LRGETSPGPPSNSAIAKNENINQQRPSMFPRCPTTLY
jgi:hypothetical protein